MERRKGFQLERTEVLSTAERVNKERIVLERDCGPRPEARKEAKGKRKVTKVTPEFAGAVGKRTLWKKTKEVSARKCMKMKMSCMRGVCWRRARTSSGKKSPARNRN